MKILLVRLRINLLYPWRDDPQLPERECPVYDTFCFGLVLWHTNHCRLFNAKFVLSIKTVLFQTIQFSMSTVFVCTHLNVKTVLFQAIKFSISMQFKCWNSSIWPIDKTLSGTTTPGQSGPESDGNERVLCIPPSSRFLTSYPQHSLGEFYLFVEMQSVYFAAPANWAMGKILFCIWWWGSSSKDLGSVDYPFIAITPSSSLTQSDSTC